MYVIGKCYRCNEVLLSMQLVLCSARDYQIIVCSYRYYSYFRFQDRGFGLNNLKRFANGSMSYHKDTLDYDILR